MKRRSELRAAIAGLAAALTLAPAAARAYCRTASCPDVGTSQVCSPAQSNDCGIALFWPNRCVGFTLQKDASSQVSLEEAEATFESAFDTWMNADCDSGGHPSFSVDYMGPVDCDEQEYNKKKANANVVMFRDASWPYEGSGTLALTTVTYNLENGQIYDADMELNSAQVKTFTLGDDDPAQFDLLSIATHETGHFLGIAHSADMSATMFANYMVGSTDLRDLSADDIDAVCAIYPPGMPKSLDCDIEPRHGFSSQCAAEQTDSGSGGNGGSGGGDDGGCAVAAAPGDGGARWPWAGLLGLGWLAGLRRKKPPES